MSRRLSLAEAKRMGFPSLDYEKRNEIPLEWAKEMEAYFSEQGWGELEVCLVDGFGIDAGGSVAGHKIGVYSAGRISKEGFQGRCAHEAGHILTAKYGIEGYPCPPITEAHLRFYKCLNVDEVAAEHFRQLYGPGSPGYAFKYVMAADLGLGYEADLGARNSPYWIKRREAVRKWWLLNCHQDFVELTQHPERITYERIRELMAKHGLK